MTAYSNSDAAKDLRSALDKAPAGAVNGEWIFITEQAGVASQTGGYRYADGSHITAGDHAFQRVRNVRLSNCLLFMFFFKRFSSVKEIEKRM
ncbi:hypothetical protein DFO56_101139 [Kosakonia sp. AG348]|nr:hypothetical protein DFO56_101139 [Kosakonia sp. AG348]